MELWIMCFERNIWVERNCYCYFCCPFFNGVWWFIVVLIYYRPSSEADDFMRIRLLENYDTRIEDISYIIIWFHIANDEGILEPRWTTFIGIANLWFMTLVPVVLMYGPVGILNMFPMLDIEVGFISTFVTATVEVYPAVDPLPTVVDPLPNVHCGKF
ncbi:hypothetical protein L5515_007093 [Caenorhabditis briggsae]|uniref:Uncharacterized protein n=1 Tax=Caenorhabditis briggsae TaxID=6238 RepID=A0AAE9F372_CAEBR|nr:hypothetical protein L5515_007093 [Caenorhabditis briggsae]